MPRTGKRKTVARGVYLDSGGWEIRVRSNGENFVKRLPLSATLEEAKKARIQLAARADSESPRPERGTLAADAPRYIALIKHLESWKDREAHLAAWIALYGRVPRHKLTSRDVLAARIQWRDVGDIGLVDAKGRPRPTRPLSAKTVNHRVNTLRNLYRTLDGKREKSPCDDVEPLHVPKTPIQRITNDVILLVDANLQAMEAKRTGPPWNAKTRARFRVFVSTGKRPCEIMRAKPEDVDLVHRVWVPRDAKGGFCPGVYLNDDQRAAWELFIQAGAWGRYNTGNFANTIRSAGWPAGVRPYQARHTTWITASELGIDLEDISVGAGHKDTRMTRRVYVPVLNSRLQRMGEALDGRFQGWPTRTTNGTTK